MKLTWLHSSGILKISFFIMLFTGGIFFCSFSQSYRPEISHLSINDGLSQSTVTDIVQDKKGFIWIGTQDGLNKRDSYDFKVYSSLFDDTTTLSNNSIKSIVIDSMENLWIGTQYGLNKYDTKKGKFERFLNVSWNENSIHNNVINHLVIDKGTLWVATDDGLSYTNYLKNSTFKMVTEITPHKISIGHVNQMVMDDNGFLWLATKQGLIVFNSKTFKGFMFNFINKNASNPNVNCINYFDKHIWFGTSTDLWSINTDSINFESSEQSIINVRKGIKNYYGDSSNFENQGAVLSIFKDSHDFIWIGTQMAGIYILDPKRKTLKPYAAGYKQNSEVFRTTSVNKIFEDYSSNIWIGTLESGLYKIGKSSSKQFGLMRSRPGDQNSLSSNRVRGLLEIEGYLWVATARGLNRFNRKNTKCKVFNHNPDSAHTISNNDVKTIDVDHLGNIWIATNYGLNLLDTTTLKFKRFYAGDLNSDSLIYDNKIRSVRAMTDGSIWVGTLGGGITVIDPVSLKVKGRFLNDPEDISSLSNNNVMNIFESTNRTIWVATYGGGLNRLQTNKLDFDRVENGLNTNFSPLLTSINEDQNRSLWIGSYGGGLCKLNTQTMLYKVFKEKDGLSNNVVYAAIPYKNSIWISTNLGLNHFDQKTGVITKYNVNDGLQSNEFNSASYLKSSTGELFFGGVEGLTFFYPDSIKNNLLPPKVTFTNFKIFNKSITPDEIVIDGDPPLKSMISDSSLIMLSHKHNVFTIEFAALDYTSPEDNEYAYQLIGFDPEWVFVGTDQRSVTYTNLIPGQYEFKVKAANSDGIWNEKPISLFIKVIPAIWQRLWFKISVSVLIIIFILLYLYNRINKTKRIQNLLEFEIREKTQEISSQKNLVEKKNEVLIKSQNYLENLNKKKDQMFYILAHNVRSPLTTLLSLMNLFDNNSGVLSRKELFTYSKQIGIDVGDSLQLLDNAFYWSIIQFEELRTSIKPNSIKKLLNKSIERYKRKADLKNIEIVLIDIEDYVLPCDEKLLTIIIQNLISNAIKYSHRNSQITIKLEKSSNELKVVVSDNGVGIDKEKLTDLLDGQNGIISEGTDKEKGTGLGLLVSKELAEKMNYELTFENADSISTRFYLKMPLNTVSSSSITNI